MFLKVIWGLNPTESVSEVELQDLLKKYQRTQDMQYLMKVLEAVEGRSHRLTLIFCKFLAHTDWYDDCVQNFFLKARDGLLKARVKKGVGVYVRQIARHQVYDQLKELRKHAEVYVLVPPEELPEGIYLSGDPAAHMDRQQFLKLAEKLINPANWEVIYRVYVLGEDRKKVAKDLGISRETLRGRLYSGIGKLREYFGNHFWLFFGAD